MPCIAGLLLVGMGCLCVFAKDFVWELTQFNHEMRGVASERTDTWDTTTTISGVVAILLGVVVIVLTFTHG